MPETSLFDAPVGPPPEVEAELAPAKKPRARKKMVVTKGGDDDLDAMMASAEVFDPGYEAHMMRVAGVPWAEIAKKIGSPSPGAAVQTVNKYLQDAARAQSEEHMQQALQTQVDRYETILRHWWDEATVRLDDKAAGIVLRTLERLDRVLRITDSEVSISRETIVVSANPDEYVKQLQEVVAARGTPPAVRAIEPADPDE